MLKIFFFISCKSLGGLPPKGFVQCQLDQPPLYVLGFSSQPVFWCCHRARAVPPGHFTAHFNAARLRFMRESLPIYGHHHHHRPCHPKCSANCGCIRRNIRRHILEVIARMSFNSGLIFRHHCSPACKERMAKAPGKYHYHELYISKLFLVSPSLDSCLYFFYP